jgi:hypothetical protein
LLPKKVGENLHVWTLPCSDGVRDFCKRFKIGEENLFFVAEFLFDGDQAAKLCAELMTSESKNASAFMIDDSYHRGLPQKLAMPLRTAEIGTADWLWARGVPDEIKERYTNEAIAHLDTSGVLNVAKTIAKCLNINHNSSM